MHVSSSRKESGTARKTFEVGENDLSHAATQQRNAVK